MRLDILKALNEERAARRSVIVVTNQDSGAQRLVKGADVGDDPLKDRAGKAHSLGQERHRGHAGRQGVPHRACAVAEARHHRRGAHQPDAGADGAIARLRRHHRRSAHGLRQHRALSRREGDRGMAGRGAAADRHRPLHGVRGAHPRSEDRRSWARHRAEKRLLLHRRARLAENPRPPRRAAEGRARLHRQRHRPHPFADRPRHRLGVARRDRGRHHRRDHPGLRQEPS